MSDCELPQYYVCKEPVARKPHKCCECSAPILPGEQYLQVNASWDNRPCVERQHKLCQKACEFVRDKGLNDDDCLAFGEFQDWYGTWVKEGDSVYEAAPTRLALWKLMLNIRRRERTGKLSQEAGEVSDQTHNLA